MRAQVKEFFNRLKRDQSKVVKSAKKRRRTLGVMPMIDLNIPDVSDFSHFIECEVAPNICPMVWEALQIDFDDQNRRYCDHCQKYVYRADNQKMIEKLSSENKCMAVSNIVLEKISGEMDENRYENLQKRLEISKLFIYFKKYYPHEYRSMQEKKVSSQNQLKEILLHALKEKAVANYIYQNEIGMEQIYLTALEYIDDEVFCKSVLEKMKNY